MNDVPSADRRRGSRMTLKSISLPFFGQRVNDAMGVHYLLMDCCADGEQIAIPGWVAPWDKSLQEDVIDLDIRIQIGSRTLNRGNGQWSGWDAWSYGISTRSGGLNAG